jgi:putative addiction module component (TIGR02574 family)
MSALEEIQQKILALPLEQRVFLAESLLGSLHPVGDEMTEAEEIAEVERRDAEINSGRVKPLSSDEFWRKINSGE